MQDTPIGSLQVWFHLQVRRFRCINQQCRQQTFAEQYPVLVERRRQRSQRLLTTLTQVGLPSQAGHRLANKLGMRTSGSTLLRLLHQLQPPAMEAPRVIGIDDWAFCKGQNYGTLIVDQERGQVIDLLPDRDGETVTHWLAKHPTIELVTRDRFGEYRTAISHALPDAVQVADRWHLLKNLGEAIQRHLSRQARTIRQLIAPLSTEKEPVQTKNGVNHRRYALDRPEMPSRPPTPRSEQPCLPR